MKSIALNTQLLTTAAGMWLRRRDWSAVAVSEFLDGWQDDPRRIDIV
jgi:hypothetical protein